MAVGLTAAMLGAMALHAGPSRAQQTNAPTVQLPDFSELVERVGPAVVNIRTTERRSASSAGGGDLDPRRTGVERVFDQFLGSARRPLDDFAGGNLVDERFGELSDGHALFSGIRGLEGRGFG